MKPSSDQRVFFLENPNIDSTQHFSCFIFFQSSQYGRSQHSSQPPESTAGHLSSIIFPLLEYYNPQYIKGSIIPQLINQQGLIAAAHLSPQPPSVHKQQTLCEGCVTWAADVLQAVFSLFFTAEITAPRLRPSPA